jgi:hypothetical protein
MTDKWRWILLVWHDWRAAVWYATWYLHAEGSVRQKFAKSMCEYHSSRREQLHRELFPPPPVEWDDVIREFRKQVR